ncbi:MAG: cytochrome c biogenesis protein CcsA [Planctomycetia bacterium]|nr:cytochrome c biogenesis protein CcsA [Planctomycetia bacterium]
MASIFETDDRLTREYSFPQTARSSEGQAILAVLKVLASLKITVVLFALAICIVFFGTLAQTQHDIWVVVREYFRAPWVWVRLQIFFPKSFFPTMGPVGGGFPFLGGWAIGALMAVNLVAAHLVRFRAQAKDARLIGGLAVVAVGAFVTTAVVMGGSGSTFQVTPLLDPSMRILWQLVQGTFAGLVLLAGCWLIFGKRAGIVLLHGGVGLMMFSELWVGTTAVEVQMHLVEGETVNFVQDIRTNELAVIDDSDPAHDSVVAIPQRLLKRGEVIQHEKLPFDLRIVDYLQNSELRSIRSDDKNPATSGLGMEMIAVEAKAGVGTSSDGKVDESAIYVEVLKKGTTESLGTYLASLVQSRLVEARQRTGLSESELRARHRVGPFVLKMSQPTEVDCSGKTYRLALRFKRTYEPYSMKLEDVRFDKYIGTNTAKNYSSKLHLSDPSRNVDTNVTVWMNNPLRYAGQTFYQSSVGNDPITDAESTGLQVVTNTGWMIPYVSCMIIVVGMLFQFRLALWRFLKRRYGLVFLLFRGSPIPSDAPEPVVGESRLPDLRRLSRRESPAPQSAISADGIPGSTLGEMLLLAGVTCGFFLTIGYLAMPPREDDGSFDWYAAGKIPVVYEGRVKPLDTLARNALMVMSNRESLRVPREGHGGASEENPKLKSQPATRWLFDVISGSSRAADHRVFRIDNPQVLGLLELNRRESHLYSLSEIRGDKEEKLQRFYKAIEEARKKPVDRLQAEGRKLLELDKRIRSFTAVAAGFLGRELHRPKFDVPDEETRQLARERRGTLLRVVEEQEQDLIHGNPPLAVPVIKTGGGAGEYEWKPFFSAYVRDAIESKVLGDRPPQPLVEAWTEILNAYAKDSPGDFNRAVKKYHSLMADSAPADVNQRKVNYEAYFNSFAPTFYAWPLYLTAFVLSVLAWLGWSGPLNRAAFWLTLLTLLLHTFALGSRMYISGRPPVTNLYSTAPFIGWGCVIGGLIFERVFRIGIGNIVSEIAGFATLLIAWYLSDSGDTFTVMQAVLDTQFWLATHVVCINLGYAPTFLAGLLGLIYVARGVFTTSLTPAIEKDLGRMIYGTLCFALFFSFFGTVLGGLWADDSWGRFWGWDPKENGALMIVLWNALVLHARWDGLVKDRGMAVLAVFGNIVTSWSWFGVNELGVGLHSYGFTEGMLMTLGIFCASQIAVIAAGCLPRDLWLSNRSSALLVTGERGM